MHNRTLDFSVCRTAVRVLPKAGMCNTKAHSKNKRCTVLKCQIEDFQPSFWQHFVFVAQLILEKKFVNYGMQGKKYFYHNCFKS
ncbi:hypothetical protein SAMN05660862_0734 [Sphingobacterium psychroaquaticum]|uniref:Uncharacterized protein n=1 Tax=Sphingobacterium psychroaquaticum TaxID=561061 RepID=A0A1X7IES5_9SPHI|nr:hypothetical protein SAMN05660862_0734 [Sphingobacterium psychroaquaticum]